MSGGQHNSAYQSQPGDVELSSFPENPPPPSNEVTKVTSPGQSPPTTTAATTITMPAGTVQPVSVVYRNGTDTAVAVTPAQEEDKEDDPDGNPLSPEGLQPLTSTNQYTVRKMAAQALMDVALMMANISQLRTLITAGPSLENYYVLMVLVSFSLVAQIMFAIIMYIVWMRESEENTREEFMATMRELAASKEPAAKVARDGLKAERAKRMLKFERERTTIRLNYFSVVLVFMITVTNMFITGFGIHLDGVNFVNSSELV